MKKKCERGKTATESVAPSGRTDFNMYGRFGGYGNGASTKNRLSETQMEAIERTLPCPHDPDALS